MQMIIEVEDTDNWSDIGRVNELLQDGMIPMGAYGYPAKGGWEHESNSDSGFASLLLLEK